MIGANDAKYIEREFNTVLSETDLVNLPRYAMYLKLMINGANSIPFNAETLPVKTERYSNNRDVIKFSINRYAKKEAEAGNRNYYF